MVKWKSVVKKNYHQLIFVVIAFLLMILVSIISMSAIARQKLLNASEEALHTVEANIRMNLQEPEATLVSAIFTVQDMAFDQNASQEEILQYLQGLTEWLSDNEERISGFNGIYGVVRGDYLDGSGWEPPADYIPQERPWYIVAKEGNGEIATTDPYIDAQTLVPIISLAQEVRSPDGEPAGVISLDVMLTRLAEYVSTLQQSYGGYGILLDNDFTVIAHPNKTTLGRPLAELSSDYANVVATLQAGFAVQGKTIYDTDGTRMILFFRKIYNGCYVGMLTPSGSYYQDMYRMQAVLIAMGSVLMFALGLILMRLAAAKIRSDEENQLKTSFLARMSHEIRTPMNSILGMVELILRKDLPADAREEALAIKQAGSNLLSIIADILDYAKIEANRLEIVNTKYYLQSLVNDVFNITNVRLENSKVELVSRLDDKLPVALEGDETRLRQVLLNLLSNAVKYTRQGSISLSVYGEIQDERTIMLIFQVSDTGIGIKEEDIDMLFGGFTRFDDSQNIGIEGTGLGLAISRKLCQLMGGDITVSSTYGKGSVFTVTLPQRILDKTPLSAESEKDSRQQTDNPGCPFIAPGARLLIVDDVESNLKVAEGLLSPYQAQVDCCTSGKRGLELLREHNYDIVFMDHMMPEMDGIEAVKKIRSLGEERFQKLPVVALTANAVSGMRELFLESGFDDYLAKPIEMAKLNLIMQKWIPQEKRDQAKADEKPAPVDDDMPAIRIAGLDAKRGLMLSGGSEARYREVLSLFCRDAHARMDIIKVAPDEENHKLFITQVHALKSALASIGGAELSAQAAALEKAGRDGDMATIRRHLDEFRDGLTLLLQNVEAALSLSAGQPSMPMSKLDAAVLTRLKLALTEEDVAIIEEIMNELGGPFENEKIAASILELSDAILISDFDEAMKIIDLLLREV